MPQVYNVNNASNVNNVNYNDVNGIVPMYLMLTSDTVSISCIIFVINFRYIRRVDPVFLSLILVLSVHKMVKRTLKIFEQILQEFLRVFEHFVYTSYLREQ